MRYYLHTKFRGVDFGLTKQREAGLPLSRLTELEMKEQLK